MPAKILTIGHSYVVRLNRTVADEIAKDQDFDITVVGPKFYHGDLRSLDFEPPRDTQARHLPLPARFTKSVHIFFYQGLDALLRREKFDLIHMWEEPYIHAGFQIARLANKHRIPYLFRTAQNNIKSYPPPFNLFEKYVVGHCSGWVAGASLVYDAMIEHGFPEKTGRIISLGVDTNHFRLDETKRLQTRERLAIKGPVIGFIGRITEAKGIHVLLKALEKVQGAWNLLMLGSGDLERFILQWASKQGYNDRVRIILADHDDVPDYINAMDLLVAPSKTMPNWREQFGRMIAEAFACKVPVIGSNSGEIPYLLKDCGIVVDESDESKWAESIEGLLHNQEQRALLANAGYQKCLQHFSSSAVAEKYKVFYKQLLEQSHV